MSDTDSAGEDLGVAVVPAEPILRWAAWPSWKTVFAQTFHGRFLFWVIAIGLLAPALLLCSTSLIVTHWIDAVDALSDAFWAAVLLLANRIGAEHDAIMRDLVQPIRRTQI